VEHCVRQAVIAPDMNDQRPKRDTMSIEEAMIPNMWETGQRLAKRTMG
jgi:hypothetical protein